MPETDEVKAAIVECIHCGTAGYVKYRGDRLLSIHMSCKCPRPTAEEANAMARGEKPREDPRVVARHCKRGTGYVRVKTGPNAPDLSTVTTVAGSSYIVHTDQIEFV